MEVKHTRGPWFFDADWSRIPTIFGADRSKVATVEKDDFIHDGKFPGSGRSEAKLEREANARLIAAAPVMLESLREARQLLMQGKSAKAAIENALVPIDYAINHAAAD